MDGLLLAIVVVAGLIGERIWHYNFSRPLAEVESDHSGLLWGVLALLVIMFAAGLLGAGASF